MCLTKTRIHGRGGTGLILCNRSHCCHSMWHVFYFYHGPIILPKLLLEIHTLTLATCSYAPLMKPTLSRAQRYGTYKIRKWCPSQWTAAWKCLWMAFIDQGVFEAMQTLSSHRAPRCDKSFVLQWWWVLELFWDIIVEHSGLNKKEKRKKEYENGPFATAHFCI